jgi:hypothetical protein
MAATKEQTTPSFIFPEDTYVIFQWLDPADLVSEPAYQRAINQMRVAKMAKEFDINLMEALTVSWRDGYKLVVVDGQHRWQAAIKAAIPTVPCRIIKGLSMENEALLFHQLATQRTGLTLEQRFKARLLGGDPIAVGINASVLAAGFILGSGSTGNPKQISAYGALENIYVGRTALTKITEQAAVLKLDEGPWRIQRVLSMLDQAWPNDPRAVLQNALLGVHRFLGRYADLITGDQSAKKLAGTPFIAIEQRAATLYRLNSGNHEVCMENALWEAYNKGLRTTKLPNRNRAKPI